MTPTIKAITCCVVLCLLTAEAAMSADAPQAGEARVRETQALGGNVERLLPDGSFTPLTADAGGLKDTAGDRIETRKVLEKNVKTIKMQNVVPPVHFDSGEAKIPDEYIGKVRGILDGMRDKKNVRLHLVGHTDNVQLSGE